MQTEPGLIIEHIQKGSLAEKSGLLSGDTLLSINSRALRDPIDFMYYSADDLLNIEVKRNGKFIPLQIKRKDEIEFGLEFKPFKVMTCKNNCVF